MWWLIQALLLLSPLLLLFLLLLLLLLSSSFAWLLQLLLSLLLLLLLLLFVPDVAFFAGVLMTFPCQKFGALFPDARENQSVFVVYCRLHQILFRFVFFSFFLFRRTFVWRGWVYPTGQWDDEAVGGKSQVGSGVYWDNSIGFRVGVFFLLGGCLLLMDVVMAKATATVIWRQMLWLFSVLIQGFFTSYSTRHIHMQVLVLCCPCVCVCVAKELSRFFIRNLQIIIINL